MWIKCENAITMLTKSVQDMRENVWHKLFPVYSIWIILYVSSTCWSYKYTPTTLRSKTTDSTITQTRTCVRATHTINKTKEIEKSRHRLN